MEDENKITTIAITLLGIVAVVALIFTGGNVVTQDQPIGGLVHNVKEIFTNGLTAEGTLTAKDATFSSTVAVTGVSTLSDELKVNRTASSTIQVGSTASGVGTGCLILGDSGASTTQPVYITATGATITATTTKPAICQ